MQRLARGLDHIVHVVRDVDAAGDFYRKLGFTVGARNRHPWGTHNRLVQFPGFFLEILAIEDPAKIVPAKPGAFSFGAFNRDFLREVGEGLSCLVLESKEPENDKRALDAAGFGGFELLNFSRQGKRPDGSDTEVGFSIAFARDPASPHTAFFTCRQTKPENFWSPEMQRHANGAHAISAAAMVAENPSDHHIFLQALADVRDVQSSSLGLTLPGMRGAIQVFEPGAFLDAFGVQPPRHTGLRLGAFTVAAADRAATASFLAANKIEHLHHRGKLVVTGPAARGAVIAFESS